MSGVISQVCQFQYSITYAVSPADGKVTAVANVVQDGVIRQRISIFLNVFDVHVNRAPIAGVVQEVEYRRGSFRNAMGADSAVENEQNIVTLQSGEGSGQHRAALQQQHLTARILTQPRRQDAARRTAANHQDISHPAPLARSLPTIAVAAVSVERRRHHDDHPPPSEAKPEGSPRSPAEPHAITTPPPFGPGHNAATQRPAK